MQHFAWQMSENTNGVFNCQFQSKTISLKQYDQLEFPVYSFRSKTTHPLYNPDLNTIHPYGIQYIKPTYLGCV